MPGRELGSLHGSVIGTVIVDSDQSTNYVETVWMPAQHLGGFMHRRSPRTVGARGKAPTAAERPRVIVL